MRAVPRTELGQAEAGQSSILMIGVFTVAVTMALAIGQLGGVLVQRGRAQAVADLVALAATHGTDVGGRIAAANGATIESLREELVDGEEQVTVVVRLHDVDATASASR